MQPEKYAQKDQVILDYCPGNSTGGRPTVIEIDAKGVYYKELNERIRQEARNGTKNIRLINISGQRYIGNGIDKKDLTIHIQGIPGEDMAAFMDGPKIIVENNAQDGVGNTMNDGKIIIHGLAGDVLGYGMRGGSLYVKGDVGYRVGIHMKGYLDKVPIMVIGGKAGDFFGEYMAGGVLVLLGLNSKSNNRPVVGDYCATGMHGGVIYIRGEIEERKLGKEVRHFELDYNDIKTLKPILGDFCSEMGEDLDIFDFSQYSKIIPVSTRPYGRMYVY